MKLGLAIALALIACDRNKPTAIEVDAAPAPVASVSATSAPLPFADASVVDACGADLPITNAKSIGHTSVVYKITLGDGRKLAWKPNAKKLQNRWRGEVAAYRLGLALGITNVPPACARSYPRATLAGAHIPDADLIGDPIEGVVIPWIDGLQFMALEKDPLRSQAASWLSAKSPAPKGDDALMAAQISSLIVFDAITGNWDRYSGGNVGLDASGKNVLFIDNDAAFMPGPPKEEMKAAQARLDATDRFSAHLVDRLRTLDEAALTSAFGPHLLPAEMVTLVATRIQNVRKTIDAKVAARSTADVLVFP